LLLEHRQKVLEGIRDRLGPHGFDADVTYRDWIIAIQHIASLSANADAECVWSAPAHPKDMTPADWQRLILALEREGVRPNEDGNT
jgi:hypothetical protein